MSMFWAFIFSKRAKISCFFLGLLVAPEPESARRSSMKFRQRLRSVLKASVILVMVSNPSLRSYQNKQQNGDSMQENRPEETRRHKIGLNHPRFHLKKTKNCKKPKIENPKKIKISANFCNFDPFSGKSDISVISDSAKNSPPA